MKYRFMITRPYISGVLPHNRFYQKNVNREEGHVCIPFAAKNRKLVSIRVRAYVVLLLGLLTACSPEDYITSEYRSTEPSMEVYFDRFEEEALTRGIEVNLQEKNIYGVLEDLSGNVVGNCSYDAEQPRKVAIDRLYWNRADDLEREYIVFHELGHCYLNREHENSRNTAGVCMSIMQDGKGKCILRYNARTRSGYIDELFDF